MSNEKNEHHGPERRKPGRSESEIRYVPMNIEPVQSEDDEVDIAEVLRMFWDERRIIYKFVGIFFVLGLIIALLSPNEFTSHVKLLPESQEEFSLGSLGGLAQQFGFGSSTSRSSDGISANLYPSIIQSNVFLEELMRYEILLPKSEQLVPLEEYVRDHQKRPFIRNIFRYTILLPFTVRNWVQNDENDTGNGLEIDKTLGDGEKLERLTNLSKQEWIVLRNIRNRITTNMDDETGVVSVNVKLQDPVIAATVADEVVQMLSEYITENRTEKARRNFEFIQERFEETRVRFEQAQKELAEFNDENRGQLTAVARTEEQLLQSRYELNFNLYNSMAERLEEARIKLQEETPVISIMEPAAVPDQKSEPKTVLLLLAFTVFGGVIGAGLIILTPFWNQLKSRMKNE